MRPVLIDVESRSRVPLSGPDSHTSRQYWAHWSTQALCCCWLDLESGERGAWLPGQDWPHKGRELMAHNWFGFDRFAAAALDFEPAPTCYDTSHAARRAGLPGSLDIVGQRLLGRSKDADGSKLTKALSAVKRPPKALGDRYISAADWKRLTPEQQRYQYGVHPDLTPEKYRRTIDYCHDDVDLTAECLPYLEPWLGVDLDAAWVDQQANDRGVSFDVDLARYLLELDATNADIVCHDVARRLGAGWTPARVAEVANSPTQYCAATGAKNAESVTVEKVDHPLSDARLVLASIARGKLRAGLRLVNPDGRLRDGHVYCGAHTWRWSQKGMQMHNMPRPAAWLEDEDPDELVDGLTDPVRLIGSVDSKKKPAALVDAVSDLVSFLVRATVTAAPGKRLVVRDFSAVEARANAWIAGDLAAVRLHLSGDDPYMQTASEIFGRTINTKGFERTVGKIAELACGYQGGDGAVRKFAKQNRVDLQGVDPSDVVAAWRKKHPQIVRYWYRTEAAFQKAIRGEPAWSQCFQYVPGSNGSVACFLPSGRPIVYNEVRHNADGGIIYRGAGEDLQRQVAHCPHCWSALPPVKYCWCGAPIKGQSCPEHGKVAALRKCDEHGLVDAEMMVPAYGGLLVENAIQAYCRDLLVDVWVRAERDGLCPVLSVHDELACEVDACYEQQAAKHLAHLMSTVPAWAAGFPVGSAGWSGVRYRK